MIRDYPRVTSLDFLQYCEPRIRQFYEYWRSKCRGRAMPSRSDIDPSEITSYLPGIVIVDVVSTEPLELVYRLVGTLDAEARGHDPTGKTVSEGFLGRSAEDVLQNYRLVVQSKGPIYDYDAINNREARLEELGTILLPLSDDGVKVNKVIVYTAFKRY